jgi:hypothetical protein
VTRRQLGAVPALLRLLAGNLDEADQRPRGVLGQLGAELLGQQVGGRTRRDLAVMVVELGVDLAEAVTRLGPPGGAAVPGADVETERYDAVLRGPLQELRDRFGGGILKGVGAWDHSLDCCPRLCRQTIGAR